LQLLANDQMVEPFRKLERSYALQIFDRENCEHILSKNINKRASKVKDSKNQYYKNLEEIIDKSDQDYTDLQRLHGYKC
jgi:hypothetical protein